MAHQQIAILHSVGCELNASISTISDLLPDLYPNSFEGSQRNLGQYLSLILELDVSSCGESQVGVSYIGAVEFDLMEVAELVGDLESRIEVNLPCISEGLSCSTLHPFW